MSKVKAFVGRVKASMSGPTWVQDVLAVAVVGTIIFLAVMRWPVPEVLSGIAWAIMGYFFGTQKNAPPPVVGRDVRRQRTQHGEERGRIVHFRCVQSSRED